MLKRLLRRIARVTPGRVLGLFVLLWLGVALVLAVFKLPKPVLLSYVVLTLIYAFFVAAWAMLRYYARMRGVMDEGEAPPGDLLLEALPEAALVAGPDQHVRAVNDHWLDLFRLSRTQALGKKYKRFTDPVLRGHLDRVLSTGQPAYGLTLSTRLPDGANLLFLADIVPLLDGALIAARPLNPDEAKSNPYLHLDRYHQLGKAYGYFLSHLKVELAALADQVRAGGDPALCDEAARLAARTTRLAAWAEADGGESSEVNAAEVVAAVADLVEPYAKRREVELVIEAADRLPAINGRAVELEHALLVLVLNALDAAPLGSIVRVSARPTADGVEIAVTDRGGDIPLPVRERLFTPFVTSRATGLGLGLSIARQIAREHGGDLLYQPEQPTGSRFTLRLAKGK